MNKLITRITVAGICIWLGYLFSHILRDTTASRHGNMLMMTFIAAMLYFLGRVIVAFLDDMGKQPHDRKYFNAK